MVKSRWAQTVKGLWPSGVRGRLAFLAISCLAYLWTLEASVVSAVDGRHWWGITARPNSDGTQTITWLEPNGLAWDQHLEVGDVIVAVDGCPATVDPVSLNTSHTIEVLDAGGRRQVELDLSRPSGFRGSTSLILPLTSLLYMLAGALVFLQANSRRQARAFVVLCVTFALPLAFIPAGALGHPLAVRLTFVSVVVAPIAFAQFLLVFPVDRAARDARVRGLVCVLIGLAAVTCLAYALLLAGALDLDSFVTVERLGQVCVALGLGVGLVSLLLGLFRDCTPPLRQQLRIAAGGAIPGILGFVGFSVLPPIFQPDQFLVDPSVSFLGTAFIPLAIGYAIIRHQLIQADVIIRRSVAHLAATVAITASYLLLVAVSSAIYTMVTGRGGFLAMLIPAVVVALVAEPIRRATQTWVERVFFDDIYTYHQLLDAPSVSLTRITSTDALIAALVKLLQAALPVDRLALFVRDPEVGAYRLRWADDGPREDEVSSDELVAVSGNTQSISRARLLSQPVVDPRSPLYGARVVVPFRSGEEVVAYLALGARRDGDVYSGADLEFLDAAAQRYAVALENALLHETVRRQADTDSLTGLYSHRYVIEHLEAAVAQARRLRRPLAVLMIDVNSFKYFNDTFGHTFGDHILWSVAQVLLHACRKQDLVGRYGGDEFIIVLHDTDGEAARILADRLARAVQQQAVLVNGGKPIALSASIGVAAMPEDGDDPLTLIAAADVSMYGQKRVHAVGKDSLPDVADVPTPALRGLLWAIQQKDGYVADHSERTSLWAVRLAAALGLAQGECETLRIAALLHDIGKLGVPEAILNKPGPLTPDERRAAEQHVELGVRLLSLVGDLPHLAEILEAVAHHHERWDGQGYPARLRGEAISMWGRIMAVADSYSAMTTDRPYRRRLSTGEALERIQHAAGSQFDPRVVEALTAILSSGDDEAPHPADGAEPQPPPGRPDHATVVAFHS